MINGVRKQGGRKLDDMTKIDTELYILRDGLPCIMMHVAQNKENRGDNSNGV